MSRPLFFAFYPTDFANDINVEAMSTLQVGAYMLLLCKAWQSNPPASLPNSDQILARLARVDAATWAEISAGVLLPFHVGEDGRLHSKRLRREYDKALAAMRGQRIGGKKGAENRWRGTGDTTGKVDGSPIGSPNGSPNGSVMGHPMGQSGRLEIGDSTVPSEQSGSCDPAAKEAEEPDKPPKKSRKKKPANPNHTPAVQAFCAAWGARYGAKYPFNRGKDADAVAFVLAAVGNDLERFSTIVAAFLADADAFAVGNRHDLGTLRLKLPRWLVAAGQPAAPDQGQQLLKLYRNQLDTGSITQDEYDQRIGGFDDDASAA